MNKQAHNYIFEYHDAITSGRIRAGKWIKAIYKILVEGIKNGEWVFDQKKANKAIKFIENYCHHSEGRNDLLKLELWQKAIVSAIFGILDKNTGYRQFREVFLVVARKNGKTLFAAAIMAYMAYIDGEYGAKLYCLAPKLAQADLAYDAFYQIVQQDEELSEISKKRRSDIYVQEFNTTIKKIAFNSKKSDGFNPHFVLNDEMEAWPGDQGLKQYDVMASALGARKQPLILSTSTAGYDRYCAGYLVQEMKEAGFHMDDVYQGTNLTPVLHTFEGDLKDGAYCLGENNLLRAHLLNVAVDININDSRMKPVKLEKRAHIDGAVSIFDALAVKMKFHKEIGRQLTNAA